MTPTRQLLPQVVVVGSVHMDLVASATRLPDRGETVHGSTFSMHPGGKGGNQAVAAARQGARTTIIARVGNDTFGRELRDRLAEKGVDVSRLQFDDAIATGASTVLAEDGGDYASIIVPGASLTLTPERLDADRELLGQAAITMVQLEISLATTIAAAIAARAGGGRVLLNASPLPDDPTFLPKELWRNVDLLIINRHEGERLSGQKAEGHEDAGRAGRALIRQLGVGAAILTLGETGAVLIAEERTHYVPGRRSRVVDTIGAGDALAGAVAAALARGEPLERALAFGNAAGALAVGERGAFAAMPTLAQTVPFLAQSSC